jgi:acetyl-CoA acyltransferase
MNDVFICRSKRTPIGRHGGALSSVRPDDLAAHVINAVLGDDDLPIDEVIFGCANQAGEDNRNVARMAVLLSRLSDTVPAYTVNRLCASGLDAVISAARVITCGAAELAIAGGVESMSRAPFVMPKADTAFSRKAEIYDTTIGWRLVNERIAQAYGIDSMPETAENVASEFDISRSSQDAYALQSQQRYDAAWHKVDIAPVTVISKKGEQVSVAIDEHPRLTSLEKLAALPAPFRVGGSITAGNAAGINDGAAALLLASAGAVQRYGLDPMARILHATSVGVSPRLMGIGPIAAVEKLTARCGISVSQFDVIELNEAFAAQVLACTRAWGLEDNADCVNAKGGGISMGHPLGMSGARIAATAARRLHETRGRNALVTLCVGVGQGVALALQAP